MCSLIFRIDPGAPWPLVAAGNRDELISRAWTAPGRHWMFLPHIVGGHDATGDGSWMALNDHGVLAVVLNREGALGPAPGKRSRGELPLLALEFADAQHAAAALGALSPEAYRPFNMLIADNTEAYWLRLAERPGAPALSVQKIPPGLYMLAAHDLNDLTQPRIKHYLPLFNAAPPPDPDKGAWDSWQGLLADRENPLAAHDPRAALCIIPPLDDPDGFGTSSASVIALPSIAAAHSGKKPIWQFCTGRPDQGVWRPVRL